MASSEESGPPKVAVTLAALAAGVVAQKAVRVGWHVVRGNDPDTDDSSALPEILLFAALSAAAVAAARSWAMHRFTQGKHASAS